MFFGLIYALLACLIWGLIFVVPGFVSDFSTPEVALGRYFSYGILSCFLLFRNGFKSFKKYPLFAWKKGLTFGFAGNITYYMGIIIGLRYATAPITVLIVGMAPIAIALYGGLAQREISYKSLIFPSLWLIAGLVLVNAQQVDWTFSSTSLAGYLIGLLAVVMALTSWTWFAIQNAQFLKKNPQIPSSEWATIIGISTFIWTILVGIALAAFSKDFVDIGKLCHFSADTARYFIAITVLGFVCSWLGCFLWNKASTYLPFSLMGPILIFETIFGLVFVYLYEFRFPSLMEIAGVTAMLTGILLSVYAFRKKQVTQQPGPKHL